jgi:hypothetical protein
MLAKILSGAAAFRLRCCLQASGVWILFLPEVGEKPHVTRRYSCRGSLCHFLCHLLRDRGTEFRYWRMGRQILAHAVQCSGLRVLGNDLRHFLFLPWPVDHSVPFFIFLAWTIDHSVPSFIFLAWPIDHSVRCVGY